MRELLRLDVAALNLIAGDVVLLEDSAMDLPTPCHGWTIADLVEHMNTEHELLVTGQHSGLTPIQADPDPRVQFGLSAARWVVTLDRATGEVFVPRAARDVDVDRVLSIHLVDMLVHRWDLARSVGVTSEVLPSLVETALPMARSMTGPDSPLVGPGRAYRQSFHEDRERDPIDNLAALLGRDPCWQPALPGA